VKIAAVVVFSALLSLGGCSRGVIDDGRWLAEATRRHALADEALDRGDEPGARTALAGVIHALARGRSHDEDRRRVLQDTHYRLATLDLRARDAAAAMEHAERGLALGGARDLFVANLLVVRGAAHEARGEAPAAAADFHAALLINEELLTESLRDDGGPP
jgi:hypothetical protein